MSKAQRAEQMLRALRMFIADLDDEQALEISEVYDKWNSPVDYKAGDIRRFGMNGVGDSQLYRCQQAHRSQEDWTPDVAPTLWKAIGISPSGYDEWSRPTGAHDAYNRGDIVSFNGELYRSLIDGNIWSPEEQPTLWEEFT